MLSSLCLVAAVDEPFVIGSCSGFQSCPVLGEERYPPPAELIDVRRGPDPKAGAVAASPRVRGSLQWHESSSKPNDPGFSFRFRALALTASITSSGWTGSGGAPASSRVSREVDPDELVSLISSPIHQSHARLSAVTFPAWAAGPPLDGSWAQDMPLFVLHFNLLAMLAKEPMIATVLSTANSLPSASTRTVSSPLPVLQVTSQASRNAAFFLEGQEQKS